jgi:hypothetical protein
MISKAFFSTAILMFGLVINVHSQDDVIGVIEYLQVEDQKEFLKLEKKWESIYKEMMKQDDIVGCSLYQVMYSTQGEKDYDFVKILWIDGFSQINFRFEAEHYINAFPDKDEDDWKNFQKKVKKSYKVSRAGVFQLQMSCANGLDSVGSYYRINEINIQPGKNKEYHDLLESTYLPVYQADVDNNNRTTWSVWAKWTGRSDSFEYITADGYSEMDQVRQDEFIKNFEKIHPNKNLDEITEQMNELMVLVNSEWWKLLYRIIK